MNQNKLLHKAVKLIGSVSGVADLLGVRRETVSRWLSGYCNMRLDTYMRLDKWLISQQKYIGKKKAMKGY